LLDLGAPDPLAITIDEFQELADDEHSFAAVASDLNAARAQPEHVGARRIVVLVACPPSRRCPVSRAKVSAVSSSLWKLRCVQLAFWRRPVEDEAVLRQESIPLQ